MADETNFFDQEDAQRFAAQAAEQTPQQLASTLRDAGVDVADLQGPQKQENYYDVNAGAMMGGTQTSPMDQAGYGQLTRGADGKLYGVGPATIYDRQKILQRSLDAGQLNPASDQYQQAIQQREQQQAQQPQNLEGMLQQIQLKPFELNQLAAYDRGYAEVDRRLRSGQYTPHEADAFRRQLDAGSANLRQRQSIAARLSSQVAQQQQMHEQARVKAMQQSNAVADAKTAQDRVFTVKDGEGGSHSFYIDSMGKQIPLTGGKTAGKGDGGFDEVAALKVAKARAEMAGYQETKEKTVGDKTVKEYDPRYGAFLKKEVEAMRKDFDAKKNPNAPSAPQQTFTVGEPAPEQPAASPPAQQQAQPIAQPQPTPQQSQPQPAPAPMQQAAPQQPAAPPAAPKDIPAPVAANYDALRSQIAGLAVPAPVKTQYVMAIDSLIDRVKRLGPDPKKWPEADQKAAAQAKAMIDTLRQKPKPPQSSIPSGATAEEYLRAAQNAP